MIRFEHRQVHFNLKTTSSINKKIKKRTLYTIVPFVFFGFSGFFIFWVFRFFSFFGFSFFTLIECLVRFIQLSLQESNLPVFEVNHPLVTFFSPNQHVIGSHQLLCKGNIVFDFAEKQWPFKQSKLLALFPLTLPGLCQQFLLIISKCQ